MVNCNHNVIISNVFCNFKLELSLNKSCSFLSLFLPQINQSLSMQFRGSSYCKCSVNSHNSAKYVHTLYFVFLTQEFFFLSEAENSLLLKGLNPRI